MSKINHYLVHRIIEHIKEVGLEHDTADFEEFDISEIIAYYNWFPVLSGKEKEIIKQDLWDLALRKEVAEVMRSMQDTDEYLAVHGNTPACEICPEIEVVHVQEPIVA